MEQVKQNMEIIDNVLRDNGYNRSLAYYIFYQSYFNYKVGNIENARYALHKFEDTNVSIQNFTISIQKLYQQVKDGINNSDRYIIMKGYLLDTDIVVFFLRNKKSIAEHLALLNPNDIFVSEVTVAELEYNR